MDLSTFSKDDFDPKEWINKTFQCHEARENKEEFATTIVAKLQSFIQEVNISLEKTAEQVNQNIPRITREIEIMRNDAKQLKEQMNNAKGDVMKVEHDASQSMQILLKIDHIKSCMQEASKALREADNWTTLSADVEVVFSNGDINEIATKLIGMQNSLEILADVPDYRERCLRLESLKDRLEAMISPRLIAAFNSQSIAFNSQSIVTDVSLMYMKIFKDLKRLSTLQRHYHNYQKNQLTQQWKQIVDSDPDETIIDWLNNFHDLLLSTWHSQMTCCQQLLPDMPAVEVLSELFVDVLTNLEPSLSFCIDAGMKLQSNPLQYLIELKQITDRLVKSLEISIHANDSKLLCDAHVTLLVKTIYSPYRQHIEKYDYLEEQQLISSLKTLNMESDDLRDYVRLLGESLSKINCLMQDAENRCQQLTQGSSYVSLLRALEAFLSEYSKSYRGLVRLFKSNMNVPEKSLIDDWSLFQQSLQATQTVGEALMQLENFQLLYIRNIREIGRKLGYYSADDNASLNLFHAYDDLLLSSSAKRELQQMISLLQEEKTDPMKKSLSLFKKLCSEIGSLIPDLVLKQAQVHLNTVPHMKIWNEETIGSVVTDLPQFSLSPQEYITEVGQYLMTIPQHIEPFILRDNPALHIALKNSNIAHVSEQDGSSNVADYLLECLARKITDCYCNNILMISHITNNATNQLVTDISYFCDVLDDLGLIPSTNLQNLLSLLKAAPDKYELEAKNKPIQVVRKISAMRKNRN
ncbi:conserved oligomeric Golgi complex subunit 7 isoform X1 [Parasteatoda tepidariorum]|uniref:conserved oligomeric Golgi complex subunit 7 isoform X1 n=1 Tax=Parasteatoda tepidariorum TaxID=114398 RepID=UPI001C717FE3|nr:conserved oligomeric Golgi complex subunit 7 isoform X1 [Parasteatoda tepidariorum]